jgi:beta-xylosidase
MSTSFPRILALLVMIALAGCAADQRNAQLHKMDREFPQLLRGPEKLPEGTWFVFAYFKDGDRGLYLATSNDGYEWTSVNGGSPVMSSPIWLRDPSVKLGPDGVFHMVFTGGSRPDEIGYSASRDLLNWSVPRTLRVMGSAPGTMACWAPELVYDEEKQRWLIAWSSEVEGRFEETRHQAKVNHRIYYTTTTDFRQLAEPRLLLDPGYTCIDPTFLRANGRYYMFFKDERDNPSKKQVRMTSAPSPEGPYDKVSDALTVTRVEGPCAIKVGDDYMVYFDEYRWDRYGAIRSRDLKSWSDVTKLMRFPPQRRHGSFLQVPREIGERLAGASAN